MSDAIITVEGLGKRYSLRHQTGERYTALRDVIASKASSLFHNPRSALRNSPNGSAVEDFWALKDVSFEVKRGEVLGIIGRNGAGKSTLLKILSRITDPTEGRVRIKGRVASLLEVGTGFHPELTGRENIYLNGAILGMHRSEIKAKFDEIVAFAQVEKFLDTPVKRYSSGMYVRLAFAVAAHLEPEILVVDEVLAVGDAEFQKKCLGKMKEVSRGGRTVLFVSHNLDAIVLLCSEAMLISAGKLLNVGPTRDVIAEYLHQGTIEKTTFRPSVLVSGLTLQSFDLTPNPITSGAKIVIRVTVRAATDLTIFHFHIFVYTTTGARVGIIDLRGKKWPLRLPGGSVVEFETTVTALPLIQGEYSLGVCIATELQQRDTYDLSELIVMPAEPLNGHPPYAARYLGYVSFESFMPAGATIRAFGDSTKWP